MFDRLPGVDGTYMWGMCTCMFVRTLGVCVHVCAHVYLCVCVCCFIQHMRTTCALLYHALTPLYTPLYTPLCTPLYTPLCTPLYTHYVHSYTQVLSQAATSWAAQQAAAEDRQTVLTVVENKLGRDAVWKLNFGNGVYVCVVYMGGSVCGGLYTGGGCSARCIYAHT